MGRGAQPEEYCDAPQHLIEQPPRTYPPAGSRPQAAASTPGAALKSNRTRPKTMGSFSFRDWINVASLMLMLSANACAISPAPQVTAPPPGQARIWFYRLWDPSESVNLANIDMNGVYVGSVEPGGAFYRDVSPAPTISCPRTDISTTAKTPLWRSSRASRSSSRCLIWELGDCRERWSMVCSSRRVVCAARSAAICLGPDR